MTSPKATSHFHFSSFVLGGVTLVASLGIDRLLKNVVMAYFENAPFKSVEVLPFFNLTEAWNRGVSFGMLAAENTAGVWGLKLFAGGIALILFYLMVASQKRLEALAYGLIIGGALGNVWDRAVYGAVYDFLDVYGFGWHFWIFNPADVFISCGVALLLFHSFFLDKSKA